MRTSAPKPLSIFYGFSAELIAQWCGVSVATARRWKRGGGVPRPALRLFALYRDGKVLDEYWTNWTTRKGVLTDPDGTSTTKGQLAAYWVVMQFAADLARHDPETAQAFHDLLKRA